MVRPLHELDLAQHCLLSVEYNTLANDFFFFLLESFHVRFDSLSSQRGCEETAICFVLASLIEERNFAFVSGLHDRSENFLVALVCRLTRLVESVKDCGSSALGREGLAMRVAQIRCARGASVRELGLLILLSIAVTEAEEIMPICVERVCLQRWVSPPNPVASAVLRSVALAVLRRRYLPLLQNGVLQSLNHLFGLANALSCSQAALSSNRELVRRAGCLEHRLCNHVGVHLGRLIGGSFVPEDVNSSPVRCGVPLLAEGCPSAVVGRLDRRCCHEARLAAHVRVLQVVERAHAVVSGSLRGSCLAMVDSRAANVIDCSFVPKPGASEDARSRALLRSRQ